ncbi:MULTISPECIES: hypothetical protein [unclassified Psychrobacter]|uniref:hypothetical protein n=1 Tax=unclassified Psychrobacter TaxID=196806 RepID=UPI0025B3E0B7|nr:MULTISPECIES: hypothetical protein [unclassified Psychrobacter]MDN3454073.1 hypothetical protein [Psychrobacter sp. APC 3350]MDN3501880.1 hypothetical protein [Psychrobacter sp. 5A.1]
MNRPTSELCMIAAAGGGIKMSSDRATPDLCTIAKALSNGAKLVITEASKKTTPDLCMIAKAGAGKVVFEFV